MSGRRASRGRSRSPGRPKSSSKKGKGGVVSLTDKRKEGGRVQFLAQLPGTSKAEWVLRTDLISMGFKSAVGEYDRAQRAATGSATPSRKGRGASPARGRSSSPGRKSARGRSRTPKGRATSRSGSTKRALASSAKKTKTPSKSRSPARARSSSRTAKKTPAKSPGRKTPAKKTPAKKTPAKKTPAKKTPAKKTPVKQSPAKKSPAKAASAPAPAGAPVVPFASFVFPEDVGASAAALGASAASTLTTGVQASAAILGAVAVGAHASAFPPSLHCVTTAVQEWVSPLPWLPAVTAILALSTVMALRRHWPATVGVEYTRFTVLAVLLAGALASPWLDLPLCPSMTTLITAIPLLMAMRTLVTAGPGDAPGGMPKAWMGPITHEITIRVIAAGLAWTLAGVPGTGIPAGLAFTMPTTAGEVADLLATDTAMTTAATALFLAYKRSSWGGLAGAVGVAAVVPPITAAASAGVAALAAAGNSDIIAGAAAAVGSMPAGWTVGAGLVALAASVLA